MGTLAAPAGSAFYRTVFETTLTLVKQKGHPLLYKRDALF